MTDAEYDMWREGNPVRGLVMNLTDQCNLRCKYCFTHPNPREMTLETAEAAMQWLTKQTSPQHHKTVTFFGGEPMLLFDEIIRPIVSKYYPQNIDFSITTNCTLFTPENIEFIRKHNMYVLLSLDGAPETQDLNRPTVDGKSSSQFIDYDLLARSFPSSTFRSTVTAESAPMLYDNYLFARRKGFGCYYVTPNEGEPWDAKSAEALIQGVFDIALCWYNDLITGTEPLYFSPLVSMFRTIVTEPAPNDRIGCGLGGITCGLAVDGTIYGCQEHNTADTSDPFYIGDIYNGINKEIHLKLLNLATSLQRPRCENKKRCAGCAYRPHCTTMTCPSKVIMRPTLDEAEIHCIFLDAVINAAFYIIAISKQTGNPKLVEYLTAFNHEGAVNYNVFEGGNSNGNLHM